MDVPATVAQFEEPLIRYATRILGDHERARDVVQDTFLRLCQTPWKDDRQLAPWLYAVTRNRAIDVRRRDAKLSIASELPEQIAQPLGEQHRAIAEVMDLIDGLPKAKGEVLRLRFRDGHSYRQISEKTGMSVNHVGVVIHGAIRTLRDQVAFVAMLAIVIGASVWATRAPAKHLRHAMPAVTIDIPAPLSGPTLESLDDKLRLDAVEDNPATRSRPPAVPRAKPRAKPLPRPPVKAKRRYDPHLMNRH